MPNDVSAVQKRRIRKKTTGSPARKGLFTMSEKILGICLIGCGRAGMIHARNYVNKVKGA